MNLRYRNERAMEQTAAAAAGQAKGAAGVLQQQGPGWVSLRLFYAWLCMAHSTAQRVLTLHLTALQVRLVTLQRVAAHAYQDVGLHACWHKPAVQHEHRATKPSTHTALQLHKPPSLHQQSV
jgi:hypothetical protein